MNKNIYIETYGCQMNFSDSEIVASILRDSSYQVTSLIENADVVLLNTCSIRGNAEKKVFNRLAQLQYLRKHKPSMLIGVLGCMAEGMKYTLLEDKKAGVNVDLVVGPDAYRDIPQLLSEVESGQKAVNVILSAEETYADITPVRQGGNSISAFISIMRGCENYCSYCVVPYTRGKERSRDPETILGEAKGLFLQGYREVTLLGQNVNSYKWGTEDGASGWSFPRLLEKVAGIDSLLRVRFSTSHPKDISDNLLRTIGAFPNICRSIHLPVQSGSNRILGLMNRKYTRESYIDRIEAIRKYIPGCTVSTDIIVGFCDETEEDHLQTLDLMNRVGFDFAYMFRYSERPGTPAQKSYTDNVTEEIKSLRLQQVIDLQGKLSLKSNNEDIGKVYEVLVEGKSKKSEINLSGRNSNNKVVVFPDCGLNPGDYVDVKIVGCTSATLKGQIVG